MIVNALFTGIGTGIDIGKKNEICSLISYRHVKCNIINEELWKNHN